MICSPTGGVEQGVLLGPLLFPVYLDYLEKDSGLTRLVVILFIHVSVFTYADNLQLLRRQS